MMMRRVGMLFGLCLTLAFGVAAAAQTVISSVYVSSSTATTATIVWTTSTPATSKVRYGLDNSLSFSNNQNFTLATSHLMTLTLLNAQQPYFFAVVSVDGSGVSAQSSTFQFALCGQAMVPVTGTVNFAYGNGAYTLTWNPPSGAVGSPTVCGNSFSQTVTGTLNTSGSFASSVADAMKVTPGPGTWTISVAGAGSIGPISVSSPISAVNQDVSVQLQSAALGAGLTPVTATANTCNPSWVCSQSAGQGGINTGSNFAIPVYGSTPGKVVGPANIGVDSTGNNLLFPSGGTILIPGCFGKVVAADGTGCVASGTGSVSGQAVGVFPLPGGPTSITLQSALDQNQTLSGAISTTLPLNNASTTTTPFVPARNFYTQAFGAFDLGVSSPAIALGIDTTTQFGQGITTTMREMFPTDGGMYMPQQMNQYSIYYGFMFNRSQGSNQLFGYGQYNTGTGDNVIMSGDQQCFGGAGADFNLGTPACQFAQNFQSTGLNSFTATVNGSGSPGQVSYTYTPVLNEVSSAGARTIRNTSRTVNTGTVTCSGTTCTFSGAPNMATLSPTPVGQLLIPGSTADGYAPNLFGTAGSATGTFLGFSNPGQVYSGAAGSSPGAGYNTGDQIRASGCGAGDALFNVIASGGALIGVSPVTIPTGTSGYSVASNCATTTVSGSGSGATVNITQVTGVVCSAGQLVNVQNFSGGTGAQSTTGWYTGQLEFACTGTNTIAPGTPFNGGGFKQPYNNVVNATAAQLVLSTPTNSVGAVAAGNIILSATSFPCQGDDVLINSICTGHVNRIVKVLSSNQVQIERGLDSRLTSGLAINTPYVMEQSFSLTNINTISHNFIAYGRMLNAVAATVGSGTTPGIYFLDGTGGLGIGLTCATPPTTPTTGNLQCPRIEVIVNSLGQVSTVVPLKPGPPSYVSVPTFTMTSASLNTGGGTANCAATCPTFTAFLNNNVTQYAWQNGDHLFEPPDGRTAMQEDQGIQSAGFLDNLGTTFQAESLGPGKIFAAFSTLGNSANGLGGHKYTFFLSPADNNDYIFFMPGGTNPLTGNPYKLQHSLINFGGGYNSNDPFLDFSQLIAPAAINLFGGTYTPSAAGTGQPTVTPAMFLKYTDTFCGNIVALTCAGGLNFGGGLNSTLATVSPGTVVLWGTPNNISAIITDQVNNGFYFENLTSGAFSGVIFPSIGLKLTDSWTNSSGTIFHNVTPATTFLNGVRYTGSQFVTSTDGTTAETQFVTVIPGGKIPAATVGILKISNSITPAAATASSCVEQTFAYTGLTTSQGVYVSPPGSLGAHIWIGWTRVSTANTLAIAFCADASAGTPGPGVYIATAY